MLDSAQSDLGTPPAPVRTRLAPPRHVALACSGLVLLGLALYAPVLTFDFVDFDDPSIVLAHPNLYDEHSFAASLRQIFIDYFPREEPLLVRDVSWALDARLFGHANPFGYHLGNLLLNALNPMLLFLFLYRATRRFAFALAVASAFALLPVHVEPVAWVMGRKDVLSAFWMLGALLAQAHELAAPTARARRGLYAAALSCTVLALFSKISAVSLFIVLILHWALHPYLSGDRPPHAPLPWRELCQRVLPRYLPHAGISACVLLWYAHMLATYGVIEPSSGLGLDHLATVLRFAPLIVGQYLAHLAWPRELSMYYRWPNVEIPLTPADLIAALLIAAGCLAGTLWCCWRRRDVAFYALSFIALLAPHLGVAYVGFWLADRYIYLSSFCLLAAVGALLPSTARLAPPLRWLPLAIGCAFAAGSGLQTWRLLPHWENNGALWQYEAHRSEPSLLSIQALAKHYVRQAESEPNAAARQAWIDKAEQEIARGLAREHELGRQPSHYRAPEQRHLSRLHSLLGRVARLEGAPLAEEVQHFEQAYALAPDRTNAWLLAQSLLRLAESSPPGEQEPLLRRSLQSFAEYLRFSRSDPRRLAQGLALLSQTYDEARYPSLAPALRDLRGSYPGSAESAQREQ